MSWMGTRSWAKPKNSAPLDAKNEHIILSLHRRSVLTIDTDWSRYADELVRTHNYAEEVGNKNAKLDSDCRLEEREARSGN
jgi:hypothetical protein